MEPKKTFSNRVHVVFCKFYFINNLCNINGSEKRSPK